MRDHALQLDLHFALAVLLHFSTKIVYILKKITFFFTQALNALQLKKTQANRKNAST